MKNHSLVEHVRWSLSNVNSRFSSKRQIQKTYKTKANSVHICKVEGQRFLKVRKWQFACQRFCGRFSDLGTAPIRKSWNELGFVLRFGFPWFLFFWVSWSGLFAIGCAVRHERMPQDLSSELDPDDPDAEFVEVDPTGRYGRVSLVFFFFFLVVLKISTKIMFGLTEFELNSSAARLTWKYFTIFGLSCIDLNKNGVVFIFAV